MNSKESLPNNNQIEAIGFDLFNTLITVNQQALDIALDRLWTSLSNSSIIVDYEEFVQAHHNAARDYVQVARQTGQETHNSLWISSALSEFGYKIPVGDNRISLAIDAYFSAFFDYCCLLPDTLRMLSSLKKRYRLGLLSNFTHPPAAKKIIETLNLRPFFSILLISGDLGYRKPKPMVFDALSKNLEVGKDKLIYIGDDPECDVDGAYEAGIESVWMSYVFDHNIPLAPGPTSKEIQIPKRKGPRISSWQDLMGLLDMNEA